MELASQYSDIEAYLIYLMILFYWVTVRLRVKKKWPVTQDGEPQLYRLLHCTMDGLESNLRPIAHKTTDHLGFGQVLLCMVYMYYVYIYIYIFALLIL